MRCTFFWKWGTTGAFLPVLAAIVGDQFCSFLHIFGGPGVPNAKQKTLQRSRNCNYKDTASGKLSASDAVMLLKYATSPNSQIFTLTFLHCLTFTHSPGLQGILSTLVLRPIYAYNFVQPCSINMYKQPYWAYRTYSAKWAALVCVQRWCIESDSCRPLLVHQRKKWWQLQPSLPGETCWERETKKFRKHRESNDKKGICPTAMSWSSVKLKSPSSRKGHQT